MEEYGAGARAVRAGSCTAGPVLTTPTGVASPSGGVWTSDELDELEAVDDPECEGGMRKGSALGGSGWQTPIGPAPVLFVAWAFSGCAVM